MKVKYSFDGKHSFQNTISCLYLPMNNKMFRKITRELQIIIKSLGLTWGLSFCTLDYTYLDMIFTSRLSCTWEHQYHFHCYYRLSIEFGKPQRYRFHSHPESQNTKLFQSNFQNLILLCTWEFSYLFYRFHYCIIINSSQQESFYLVL